MKLTDLIPDPEVLIALEPNELGLRLLPLLVRWPKDEEMRLKKLLSMVLGPPQIPGQAPTSGGLYPSKYRLQIEEALEEAWAWLVGSGLLALHLGNTRLSRGARKLAQNPDRGSYGAGLVPKEVLHPSIREEVWALYHRGKYDTAVFEAMKAVEVAVREAAGLTNSYVGVALMRAAFGTNGPLTDTTVEAGEQEARAHLFAGAIGSYKNPHSHRNVDLEDRDEAAEIILLANHLLRIVDDRRPRMTGGADES